MSYEVTQAEVATYEEDVSILSLIMCMAIWYQVCYMTLHSYRVPAQWIPDMQKTCCWSRNRGQYTQLCGYLRKFSQRNLGSWYSLAQQKWEICESFLPRKFPTIRYIIQEIPLHFHTPRYNGGSLSDGGGEGEVWAGETVDTRSSPWRPVPVHAKNTERTVDTMMASFSLHVCPLLTPSLYISKSL